MQIGQCMEAPLLLSVPVSARKVSAVKYVRASARRTTAGAAGRSAAGGAFGRNVSVAVKRPFGRRCRPSAVRCSPSFSSRMLRSLLRKQSLRAPQSGDDDSKFPGAEARKVDEQGQRERAGFAFLDEPAEGVRRGYTVAEADGPRAAHPRERVSRAGALGFKGESGRGDAPCEFGSVGRRR